MTTNADYGAGTCPYVRTTGTTSYCSLNVDGIKLARLEASKAALVAKVKRLEDRVALECQRAERYKKALSPTDGSIQ